MAIDFDLLREAAISARRNARLLAETATRGGTCNMDKCALDLGRHYKSTQVKVEALFKDLGIHAYRRSSGMWKGLLLDLSRRSLPRPPQYGRGRGHDSDLQGLRLHRHDLLPDGLGENHENSLEARYARRL